MQQLLHLHQQTLAANSRMLDGVSPLPTLARGYAILRSDSAAVISRVADLAPGQSLRGQLQDGSFNAQVSTIQPGDTLNATQRAGDNSAQTPD